MTSEVTPAPRYTAACDKGQRLLKLMRASHDELFQLLETEDTPAESEHLSQDAFKLHGWSELFTPLVDENLKRLSEGLGIDILKNQDISHYHQGSEWPLSRPTTNAYFDTVVNPSAGMIAAVNTRSPMESIKSGRAEAWKVGDEPPDLKFWSDVAYLHWASVAGVSSKLRYVIRVGITNEKTKAVIEHIMRNTTSMEQYPVFPGISWYTDQNEEAAALLGTPNGSGVAWLLIQHKAQLGHKIVDKVTLVYNERSPPKVNTTIPSLVFELRDVVTAGELSGEK